MNKMVSYPYSAIPTMIKKIHFNDKYPANRDFWELMEHVLGM